jgi:hypothetical protein
MGWTGRAPAPDGTQSAPGACQEKERRHASHVQRSRSERCTGYGLRLVSERTAVINQIRGFLLERGLQIQLLIGLGWNKACRRPLAPPRLRYRHL